MKTLKIKKLFFIFNTFNKEYVSLVMSTENIGFTTHSDTRFTRTSANVDTFSNLNTGVTKIGGITLASPSVNTTYTTYLPTSVGVATQLLTTDGNGQLSWTNFSFPISNTLVVSKTPMTGQFSSVIDALNNLPSTPSATNPLLILVYPGIYVEPSPIVVPSYVHIMGQQMNCVTISTQPFTIGEGCSLSNFVISSVVGTGITITNNSRCYIWHVTISGSTTGISISSSTINTTAYLEHVSLVNFATRAISISTSGTKNCLGYVQDCTIVSPTLTPTDAILVSGTYASLLGMSDFINGYDRCTYGIHVSDGATAELTSVHFSDLSIAIYSDNVGSGAKITANACLFHDNTSYDIKIFNVSTTGFYDGYIAKPKFSIVPTSTFYITNMDLQVVTVRKSDGDYSSVKSAMDNITDATTTKRYIIDVGPGIFTEDPFTMKSYVTIEGQSSYATVILANNLTTDFITFVPYSAIRKVLLGGPTTIGTNTCVYLGSNLLVRPIQLNQVRLTTMNNFLYLNSSSGAITFDIDTINVESVSQIVSFAKIASTNPCIGKFTNIKYPIGDSSVLGTLFDVSGSNTNVEICDLTLFNSTTKAGVGISVYNGATLRCLTGIIKNFTTAIQNPDTGTGADLTIANYVCSDNTNDIIISSLTTTGSATSSVVTESKITSPNGIFNYTSISDVINHKNISIGPIVQGTTFDTRTNTSYQTQNGASLGIFTGGVMSVDGGNVLKLNITSGSGYLMISSSPDYLKFVEWGNLTYTFTITSGQITSLYFYTDAGGTLLTSSTEPNYLYNVIFGRVTAGNDNDGSGTNKILLIQSVPRNINNQPTKIDNSFRNAFGSIVKSGLLTSCVSGMNLNVTSGEYTYSVYQFLPSSVSNISMNKIYRNSVTPTYKTITSALLDTKYNNLSTYTLVSLGATDYAKHVLMIVGSGSSQTYLLIYGTTAFADKATAIAGDLPVIPSWINSNAVQIAGIVVGGSDTTIASDQIIDIRPTLSYKTPSSIGVITDHSSLSNLDVDSHPQYLPLNGSRAMTADLDIGGKSITNVNLVDGVDVPDHHARHDPAGLDGLTMGVLGEMKEIDDTTASIGSVNKYIRVDHVHAHGNRGGGTLHATAIGGTSAGFISATDQKTIDDATDVDTPSTLVKRGASGETSVRSLSVKATGGNTGTTYLYDSDNSNYIALKSADTISSNYTLKLPSTIGTSGQVLQTNGVDTTTWATTSTYIDPLTTNGDITARIGGVTSRLPIGSTYNQAIRNINGTLAWSDTIVPKSEAYFFDDFIGPLGSWTTTTSSGSATLIGIDATTSNSLGIVSLTSTNALGRACLSRQTNSIRMGLGVLSFEIGAKVPVLGLTCRYYLGFGNIPTDGDMNNGVYFTYDPSVSGTNWLICTANSGSRTPVDSGVAITTNFTRFKAMTNSAGTSVTFYINDVSCGTIVNTLPNVATTTFGLILKVQSNSVNSDKSLLVDYVMGRNIFVTERYT